MLERSKLGPPARVLRLLRLGSRALGAVLLACSPGTAPGEARASRTELHVQVVVARFAQVRMVSSPRSLEITPEHVRLGYVDVPAGTVFSVRCNSSRGVTLQVQVDPQLVEGGTITGAGVPVALVGGTAVLLLPGPHPHDSRFELRWRLRLAPEARAGTYPWPVQVQMQGA